MHSRRISPAHKRQPWRYLIVLAVLVVSVCGASAAALRLRGRLALDQPPASLAGLPLVEVPAPGIPVGITPHPELLAVLLTGDGGWSATDRKVAEHFAARGVPVVGWNSLRYYWQRRSPNEASTDLARIITHYTAKWQRPRVVLIGYSFGADVLPFLVPRLTPEARSHVAGVTLLGFAPDAGFEFHLPGWLGIQVGTTYPTAPEVRRMLALQVPVLCINGRDEGAQGCPELPGDTARVLLVASDHDFEGWYRRISQLALQRLRRHGRHKRVATPADSHVSLSPTH